MIGNKIMIIKYHWSISLNRNILKKELSHQAKFQT